MIEHSSGQIITFYSYKGGTGRTMALANIACLLARHTVPKGAPSRPRVVAIDWDFEAPGLHRYFEQYLKRDSDKQFESGQGCLELFEQVDHSAYEPNDFVANRQIAREWFETHDFEKYLLPTNLDLSIIKAGRFDESYPRRVSKFRWEDLFSKTIGLFAGLADFLRSRFDYVLIDSRTGITDTSGICTMLLPDKLVVVFTPNQQSLTGIENFVSKAVTYRKGSPDGRPLTVFPLPSRIEMARPQLLTYWRNGLGAVPTGAESVRGSTGYQPTFERLFSEIYGQPNVHLDEYFKETLLQHIPDYAYGEPIAVALETDDSRISLSRSYSAFLDRLIELDVPWRSLTDVRIERTIVRQCDTIEHVLKERASQQALAKNVNAQGAKKRAIEQAVKFSEDAIKLSFALIEQKPPEHLFERWTETILEVTRAVQFEDKASARRLMQQWKQSAAIPASDLDPATFGQALLTAGALSREVDDLILANDLFSESYSRFATELGDEHPITLSAMDHLAAVSRDLKRFEKAQELNERALEIRLDVLGEDDPATIEAMTNLALTLFDKGDVEATRVVLNRLLVIYRRPNAAIHSATLESLTDSALKLIVDRDLPDIQRRVRELLEQMLATYRGASENENFDDLTSVSDLADIARAKNSDAPEITSRPIASVNINRPAGLTDVDHDLYFSPGYQSVDKMVAKLVAIGDRRIEFPVIQSGRLDGLTLKWSRGSAWMPFDTGTVELSSGQTLVIFALWLGW